jgi:hypothetical protein
MHSLQRERALQREQNTALQLPYSTAQRKKDNTAMKERYVDRCRTVFYIPRGGTNWAMRVQTRPKAPQGNVQTEVQHTSSVETTRNNMKDARITGSRRSVLPEVSRRKQSHKVGARKK